MKEFCEECREDVEVIIKEEKNEIEICNQKIEFDEKCAYCTKCDARVDSSELRDLNLCEIDRLYREKENIIQIIEIESILKKYNVGKRPLSIILGWGEGTLTRYLDGDTPSKKKSKELEEINNYPKLMLKKLKKSKNKITDLDYQKCLNEIQNILGKKNNKENDR